MRYSNQSYCVIQMCVKHNSMQVLAPQVGSLTVGWTGLEWAFGINSELVMPLSLLEQSCTNVNPNPKPTDNCEGHAADLTAASQPYLKIRVFETHTVSSPGKFLRA